MTAQPHPATAIESPPLITEPMTHGHGYRAVKRMFDVSAAVLLLIVLAPVMLMAGVLVKLSSRGPVFYRQVRSGRHGVEFRVWKFRTMINNAEALTGPVWATRDDPRITWIGRILRDTHIDEFPQLFNVLEGSMSLVGPRPERPEIIEELEQHIPPYPARMQVRPGITGFAQLRLPADSDIPGVRQKLAHDLYYIQHMGFWLDLRIVIVTGLDFGCSLLKVLASFLFLPRSEEVEKLLPYLMDESSARETFEDAEPAAAIPLNGKRHPPRAAVRG